MIATRLALGKTVCAGCNAPINGKGMIPDGVQYRWEGRDYDRYCLSNALGQRVSDAGKWVQVALVAVPATDRVAVAELWEAARAASGNTPDGCAWGYNRRQFVALARELNRMGYQRVIRAGAERKSQSSWRGYRLATDAEREARVVELAGEWTTTEALRRDLRSLINALADSGRIAVVVSSLPAAPTDDETD